MCYSCANGGPELGAYLVRVSTHSQEELSPETQLGGIPWVEAQGPYKVPEEYIINITWASQELLDCPEISDKLIPLIKEREIHFLGMLHSDRMACSEGTAAYLYELCEKNRVKLLAQIEPFIEGDFGAFLAAVRGFGKRTQVVGNRPRIKLGLENRAKLHGRPVNTKAPYGYRVRSEIQEVNGVPKLVPVAYEPDPATYVIAQNIFRMVLDGKSTRSICAWLYKMERKSPRGNDTWGESTITNMLKNPTYTGVYYALRHELIEPKKRAKPGQTFGKSSTRSRDKSEWYRLKDFKVESPIITPDEYEIIQAQLLKNQEESKRKPKGFYMLSGMVFCGVDGRCMNPRGSQKRSDFYYCCSKRYRSDVGIPRCPTPQQYGLTLEKYVWDQVYSLLTNPAAWWAEMQRQTQGTEDRDTIDRQIRSYRRKLQEIARKEAELLEWRQNGEIEASEEAFKMVMSKRRAERSHCNEEIERLKGQKESLKHAEQMVKSLEELRERILGRLDSATPEDKRWLLENLHTRVTINEGQKPLIQLGVPKHIREAVEGAHGEHNSQV